MPRLSIIIPVLGDPERFEQGLVSVLEHRPPQCEVVAVFATPYSDPHELADEIQLIQAPRSAGLVDCLRLGWDRATGSMLHTLACGVEVSEGWTDWPTELLIDPETAAVAPLALERAQSLRVVSAGVECTADGRRVSRGQGAGYDAAHHLTRDVLGASLAHGFFRRDAVDAVGGWQATPDEAAADIDLALRLRASGFRARYEVRSEVFAGDAAPLTKCGAFRRGRCDQMFSLRNGPLLGWDTVWSQTKRTIAADALLGVFRPSRWLQSLGRLAACWSVQEHAEHWNVLDELLQQGPGFADEGMIHNLDRARRGREHPSRHQDRWRRSA